MKIKYAFIFLAFLNIGCKQPPHVTNPPLKAGVNFGDHFFMCSYNSSTPLDLIAANYGAMRIQIIGKVSPQFTRTYLFYPGQFTPIDYTVSGDLHLPPANPTINNPCINNIEIPFKSGFSVNIRLSEKRISPCEGENCFIYFHNEDFLSRESNWNQSCNSFPTVLQPVSGSGFISFCLN
jgi:hypothetical protein